MPPARKYCSFSALTDGTAYGELPVASLLFFFIGYSVLLLGRNLKAKSHVDIVHFTNGRIFGSVIDAIITVFLFGGFAVMIAGAGAIFKEQFHLSAVWGTMFMAFATLLTVFTGTKGVINAISSVVPFLIFSVLFISVFSLLTNPVTQTDIKTASAQNGATPDWLLSAINYASYNIVVAVAVLAPMGAITENKQKNYFGAPYSVLPVWEFVLSRFIFVSLQISLKFPQKKFQWLK